MYPRSFPHRSRSKWLSAALLASCLVALAPARAAITTYTDEATFLSLFPDANYATEDFSSTSTDGDPYSLPFSYPDQSISYTISTVETEGNALFRNASNFDYGTWLGTLLGGQPVTITFDTGVRGIGGYFFLTDLDEAAADGNVLVSINGGDPINLLSVSSGTQPFVGFLGTGGDLIHTLEISDPAASSENFVTISKLTASNVPEPSSLVLLTGVLSAGLLWRKRTRKG